MKKRAPVSKIMTSNLISVNKNNSISEIVKIFDERNIHHVPVVSGDKLIGMISKSDIDRISYVTDFQEEFVSTSIYKNLNVEQIMSRQLLTIQREDQIKDAAEMLAQGSYHALPVMEGENLVGIVTSTDVINYLLDQY